MITTYRVIRTSMCAATAAAFVNYDTTNINVAHQLCGDYINFYCRTKCGCIFSVVEVELLDFGYATPLDINITQPITVTLPNNMWTTAINPTTATWQYAPSTITGGAVASGGTLIYDNSLNKWATTSVDTTLTGDISGAITTNTVRVATDPDIKF